MNDDAPTDRKDVAEEGFLSRWSRRKRQPAETGEAVAVAAQTAVEPEPEPEPEPQLTDADMPPIDSLDEQSDYSGFLSPGVSQELRQLALRKLFRAASFNVTDGLDDYDDDFTSFAKLGDIVTREMRIRDAVDAAREKAKAALAATDSAPSQDATGPGEAAATEAQAPADDDAAAAGPAAVEAATDSPESETPDQEPSHAQQSQPA